MARDHHARGASARRCLKRWSAIPPSSRIGEDIGVYGGAFKVTEGLLAEVRAESA